MSIVIAVLIAVSIGLIFSVVFAALSPRIQCSKVYSSGHEMPYNICVLPKLHKGHHVTADGLKFFESGK